MTTLYDIDGIIADYEAIQQINLELNKTIKRQRVAIERLLKAIRVVLDEGYVEAGGEYDLEEVYKAVSSASTMTGVSER
jgi:hypothetical protein